MNETKKPGQQNEGEGNKTADKQYREGATKFAKSGEALPKAEQAQREVESNPREFADAEAKGRAHGERDTRNDLEGATQKK